MAQSTEGLHKSHNIWLKGKKFVSLILSTLVNKRKYEYNISIYPQFARPMCIKLFKVLKCFKAYNLIFICWGKKKKSSCKITHIYNQWAQSQLSPQEWNIWARRTTSVRCIQRVLPPLSVGWLYRSKEASHGKTQRHLASGSFLSPLHYSPFKLASFCTIYCLYSLHYTI